MLEMKDVNEEAFKNMIKIPPRFWRKPRFRRNALCDTLVNNMLEAFNSAFVTTRAKPIVIMIEEIRVYPMLRLESNMHKISKNVDDILPSIKRRIKKPTIGL